MIEMLLRLAGPWFVVALAAAAAAAFVKQAGAPRSPEEDTHGGRGVALAMFAAGALAPALLIAHAFVLTRGLGEIDRAAAMAAPVAALLAGALLGASFGAAARGLAPIMRRLAAPLMFAALAVALYAASPSLQTLFEATQRGGFTIARP